MGKSIVIIGAGPGGFTAALEATSKGLSATLVDKGPLGGACTNRGCIPSKFFLSRAKRCADAQSLKRSGIAFRQENIRFRGLVEGKDAVLETLRTRMQQALKAGKIRYVQGAARFTGPRTVAVSSAGAETTLEADAILLAAGSQPVFPKTFPRHPAIITSDTIFDLGGLPSHLAVIGGGYIGCELACAFQGLGSKVTLIEMEPRLFSTQPEFAFAGKILEREFAKRGLSVWTGVQVQHLTAIGDQHLRLACSNGQTLDANAVLVSMGRRPNLKDLNLAAAGLDLVEGRLPVNLHHQTSVPHIYAIGDLVNRVPLAHTASWEGHAVVSHLTGGSYAVDYDGIPRCVYTWPEIAAVGLTEKLAAERGISARLDRYHVAANSKAVVEGETDGVWLLLSDAATGRILGGQIIGPHATELIHLIALAMKGRLTTSGVAETIFAHPTLSEGFQELASRSLAREMARKS